MNKFVISYKLSSISSVDVYIEAKDKLEIASEINDAVWFADRWNNRLANGFDVEPVKTEHNFKNNRFQIVIFGTVSLNCFESQCVTKSFNESKINWKSVNIFTLDEWFEYKCAK